MNQKIVIVGGGIAGLSAASALARTGCEVTIFEAKNRLGGRIHTITNGGPPVELGAEFLHGENPAIRNAINAAGLSTQPIAEDYHLTQYGRFKHVNLPAKMSKIVNAVNVRGRDCSFQDFLDGQRLSPGDRAQAIGFVEGFHAARPELISAQALRRGEYSAAHMPATTQSRIIEGYGALVQFLEQETRDHGVRLVTNAVVEKIRWQPGRVEVTYHHGHRQSRQIFHAHAAVITLPLGVLKAGAVEFQPSLGIKREAIEQLHFGNVVKVIFQFRETWWPDFGFAVALNEALPTWWTDPRGPILTGWAGGPKADALLEHSGAELEALGREILGRIFPKHADAIAAQLISVHTVNWAHDPHIRGAYSYLPVNGLDLPKLLGAPISDTLFFAGEATVTDAQTGTVFGAFETGLRASREVLATIADSAVEAVYPKQR